MDVLLRTGSTRAYCSSRSARSPRCAVERRLSDQGIATTVVDPRWVMPVDPALRELAPQHQLRGHRRGQRRGRRLRRRLAQALRDAGVDVPLRDFGIPPASSTTPPAEILAEIGLTAPDIAR